MLDKFTALSLKKKIGILSGSIALVAVIIVATVFALNKPSQNSSEVASNKEEIETEVAAVVESTQTVAKEVIATETQEQATETEAATETEQKETEKAEEKKEEKKQGQKKSESKNTDKKSESNEKRSDDKKNNDDSDSSSNSRGGFKELGIDYVFDSKEDYEKLVNSLEGYEEEVANRVISKAVNNITMEEYCKYANKYLYGGEEIYSTTERDDTNVPTFFGEKQAVWAYYCCKKGYNTNKMISYVKSVARDVLSGVKDKDAVFIDVHEDQDWAQIIGKPEDTVDIDIAIHINLHL